MRKSDRPRSPASWPTGRRGVGQRHTAVGRLKALTQAWSSLAELTPFGSDNGRPVLRLADVTADDFDKVGRRADA